MRYGRRAKRGAGLLTAPPRAAWRDAGKVHDMPNQRSQPDEYSPHHEQYVSLITGPIVDELKTGRERIARLVDAVPEERGGYRYADRKWTIREVIGHMADAERIHTFRALTFARNDRIELPKWGPD